MNDADIVDSLRSFHALSKAINSSLNIAEVERIILDTTSKLMKAQQVVIFLLDESKTSLRLHCSMGLGDSQVKFRDLKIAHPFDHCLVHKGTVITLRDILSDVDLNHTHDRMPHLLGMFFAPLEVQGAAYGLLGVPGMARNVSAVELEIFCSLGSQAAVAMENAFMYQKLLETFLHTSESLAEAINIRDPYTGGHARRVREYALMIADRMMLSGKMKDNLRMAAMLHDIGKIGIDDVVLRKSTGLTDEEASSMHHHPDIGAQILSYADDMADVIPGVRHHHERFDGGGYPDGLAGEAIPLNARIIAIADAYDALTTSRPYRKELMPEQALARMYECKGTQFDPELLELFAGIIGSQNLRAMPDPMQ